MAEQVKFEHSALEKDISNLVERMSEVSPEREFNKENLKSMVGEMKVGEGPGMAPEPVQSESNTSGVLPSYMTNSPEEIKYLVEKSLDVAWHKGVAAGFNEAKKGGPLVLDAFHDAITDKMFEELKKRGKI